MITFHKDLAKLQRKKQAVKVSVEAALHSAIRHCLNQLP